MGDRPWLRAVVLTTVAFAFASGLVMGMPRAQDRLFPRSVRTVVG